MNRAADDDPLGPFRRRLANQLDFVELPWAPLDAVDVVPVEVDPDTRLYDAGDEVEELYAVTAGWLIGCSYLRNGRRYIHRIYQPGDVVGTEDTNWNYGTSSVETITACRLGRFRKEFQYTLFAGNPRLGAALYGLSMNDQVVLMDAARANARLSARDRLAHLLLQIEARTRLSNAGAPGDPFEFPLNQSQIGDATGLTNVSVSKAMVELTNEGAVSRRGTEYRLLERDRLVERSEFVDRYVITMGNWRRLLEAA